MGKEYDDFEAALSGLSGQPVQKKVSTPAELRSFEAKQAAAPNVPARNTEYDDFEAALSKVAPKNQPFPQPQPALDTTTAPETAPWYQTFAQPGSRSEAAIAGFSNAATLGLGKYISAAVRSSNANPDDTFASNLGQSKQIEDRAVQQNPGSYFAGSLLGGIAPGGYAVGKTVLGTAGRSALQGAIHGAADSGVDEAGNVDSGSAAEGATVGGTLGGVIGGGVHALSPLLGKTLGYIKSALQSKTGQGPVSGVTGLPQTTTMGATLGDLVLPGFTKASRGRMATQDLEKNLLEAIPHAKVTGTLDELKDVPGVTKITANPDEPGMFSALVPRKQTLPGNKIATPITNNYDYGAPLQDEVGNFLKGPNGEILWGTEPVPVMGAKPFGLGDEPIPTERVAAKEVLDPNLVYRSGKKMTRYGETPVITGNDPVLGKTAEVLNSQNKRLLEKSLDESGMSSGAKQVIRENSPTQTSLKDAAEILGGAYSTPSRGFSEALATQGAAPGGFFQQQFNQALAQGQLDQAKSTLGSVGANVLKETALHSGIGLAAKAVPGGARVADIAHTLGVMNSAPTIQKNLGSLYQDVWAPATTQAGIKLGDVLESPAVQSLSKAAGAVGKAIPKAPKGTLGAALRGARNQELSMSAGDLAERKRRNQASQD